MKAPDLNDRLRLAGKLPDLLADTDPMTVTSSGVAETADLPCTDVGNAARLSAFAAEKLRHCRGFGWLAYDGKRWRKDSEKQAVRVALACVESMQRDVRKMGATEKGRQLASWWIKSQSSERIAAMLRLAESDPTLSADVEDFDRDPWLLNVVNGVVDLRTGALRSHSPTDMMTKIAGAPLVADAQAPRWGSFLEEILPEPETRALTQRYFGSACSGAVREHAFLVAYGQGRNGKGTMTRAIQHVLGEYHRTTPFSSFLALRDEGRGATPELADLVGARLVTASEGPESAKLDTPRIKDLTGGDPITARRLYAEPFTFRPQFKLVLVTNHKPRIPETTDAIWDRVLLVPFEVYVPAERRDPDLDGKLQAEAPGILAWLVTGCRAWLDGGLTPPEAVRAATRAYRQDEDPVAGWIAESCEIGPQFMATANELRESFNVYATREDREPLSPRGFGIRLRERGFHPLKDAGERTWRGLRLRST